MAPWNPVYKGLKAYQIIVEISTGILKVLYTSSEILGHGQKRKARVNPHSCWSHDVANRLAKDKTSIQGVNLGWHNQHQKPAPGMRHPRRKSTNAYGVTACHSREMGASVLAWWSFRPDCASQNNARLHLSVEMIEDIEVTPVAFAKALASQTIPDSRLGPPQSVEQFLAIRLSTQKLEVAITRFMI